MHGIYTFVFNEKVVVPNLSKNITLLKDSSWFLCAVKVNDKLEGMAHVPSRSRHIKAVPESNYFE